MSRHPCVEDSRLAELLYRPSSHFAIADFTFTGRRDRLWKNLSVRAEGLRPAEI